MPATPPTDFPDAPDATRRTRGRPRKTLDERDDGNRRQALLQAAAHLFRQQGFAGTSTRDIAAAAGMQAGSPFYHFENKQALLAGVMLEGMQRAVEHQRQALAQADAAGQVDARQRLRVLVRAHFDVLLGPQSDFVPVMLYEWRSLTPVQRKAIARIKDEYEAAWMPVLEALAAQGALQGDAGVARLFIFGALNWAVQWFSPRKGKSLDELTDEALALFIRKD